MSKSYHIQNFTGRPLLSAEKLLQHIVSTNIHSPLSSPGKSSLLSAIGNYELPVPQTMDIFHLKREMAPSDRTALEAVMEVDEEKKKLELEAEHLACKESEGERTGAGDGF